MISMPDGSTSRTKLRLVHAIRPLAAAMALILWAVQPSLAEVKTSATVRYYDVPGSKLSDLARFVARNPLAHRTTGAIGRTEAKFDFELFALTQGSLCKATEARISATFVMTLPKASEARLSKADRVGWRAFVAFVRRHEETHVAIYTQCMRSFERVVRTLSSNRGCQALTAEARKRFEAAIAACEQRHNSLDARDGRALGKLPLFRALQ